MCLCWTDPNGSLTCCFWVFVAVAVVEVVVVVVVVVVVGGGGGVIPFNHQDDRLVVGGYDKQIRLYDIATKRCIHVIDAHANRSARQLCSCLFTLAESRR